MIPPISYTYEANVDPWTDAVNGFVYVRAYELLNFNNLIF